MRRLPLRLRITALVVIGIAIALVIALIAFSSSEDVEDSITRTSIDNFEAAMAGTSEDLNRSLDATHEQLIFVVERSREMRQLPNDGDEEPDDPDEPDGPDEVDGPSVSVFTETGERLSFEEVVDRISADDDVPIEGPPAQRIASATCRQSGEGSRCNTSEIEVEADSALEPAEVDLAIATLDRLIKVEAERLDPDPGVALGRVVALDGGRVTVILIARQDVFATDEDGIGVGIPQAAIVIAVGATLLGGAAWLLLGRALSPVGSMIGEVETISQDNLHQRVTVPSANDELKRLATTMNAMLDRLQHSRDQQRQFISDASHELRSPITASKATLEVARNSADQADWEQVSNVLWEENDRLEHLVDDLLLLARLDEQSDSITPDWVDLDELCLSEAGRPHPVPVRVEVLWPARVPANLQMLTRCVRNLVDNAARHAASEVVIEVSVVRSDPGTGLPGLHAMVRVQDDGPGIPPEQRARVFERFTRVSESRVRNDGGSGLGLAISREIAAVHGGSLTIEDGELSGATFVLRLPMPG